MSQINIILNLIEKATTIDVVSNFLKNLNLKHSAGSWFDLREKRILPALKDKKLKKKQLVEFLESVEEYGRKHIFLYNLVPSVNSSDFISAQKVQSILNSKNNLKALNSTSVLNMPSDPELACVRWENYYGKKSLVVKYIKTRHSREKISETMSGSIETVKYRHSKERAQYILKISETGDVEIRISSQGNIKKYEVELNWFWDEIKEFLDISQVNQVSLTNAKNFILENSDKISDVVNFSGSTLRNDKGNIIKAATGEAHGDLSKDKGLESSLSMFRKNNGFCDSSNIFFLPNEEKLSRALHVILSGVANEFSIGSACNKEEYDYVIGKIRKFNQ